MLPVGFGVFNWSISTCPTVEVEPNEPEGEIMPAGVLVGEGAVIVDVKKKLMAMAQKDRGLSNRLKNENNENNAIDCEARDEK